MQKESLKIKAKEATKESIVKLIAEAKELQKESKEARSELKRLFFL